MCGGGGCHASPTVHALGTSYNETWTSFTAHLLPLRWRAHVPRRRRRRHLVPRERRHRHDCRRVQSQNVQQRRPAAGRVTPRELFGVAKEEAQDGPRVAHRVVGGLIGMPQITVEPVLHVLHHPLNVSTPQLFAVGLEPLGLSNMLPVPVARHSMAKQRCSLDSDRRLVP